MRYSTLFGKAQKTAPRDADSANARLLLQGGFVDQTMAGVYSWLPLGLAVLRKVEDIVREEMNALGAQEIFMPSLQPKEFWDATGRWNTFDVLFKLQSQTEKQYALGSSHEEVVTPLACKFIQSHRDLPRAVYQINTKFRDELRAKSGVLRGREFRMKDMYSFHTTQEDLNSFYALALKAYVRAFSRCGLNVKVVEASGGVFTKNLSHEFHALTDAGEDVLIVCTKCEFGQNSEVTKLREGEVCPNCGSTLTTMKGVEVGNIFDLGTKYSDAFKLDFSKENGERARVLMGCYGIGTSRLVGAIVESSHDDKGIIWPKRVAPCNVHLVSLGSKDADARARVETTADSFYDSWIKEGVSVLYDDRPDTSAGEKFGDADLIGIPLRIVVSERTLREDSVEWKGRADAEARLVKIQNLSDELFAYIKE